MLFLVQAPVAEGEEAGNAAVLDTRADDRDAAAPLPAVDETGDPDETAAEFELPGGPDEAAAEPDVPLIPDEAAAELDGPPKLVEADAGPENPDSPGEPAAELDGPANPDEATAEPEDPADDTALLGVRTDVAEDTIVAP